MISAASSATSQTSPPGVPVTMAPRIATAAASQNIAFVTSAPIEARGVDGPVGFRRPPAGVETPVCRDGEQAVAEDVPSG